MWTFIFYVLPGLLAVFAGIIGFLVGDLQHAIVYGVATLIALYLSVAIYLAHIIKRIAEIFYPPF